MTIYLPKQIVPIKPTITSPLFFLMGPIRGGGDWQGLCSELIMKYDSGANIACPCRWDDAHRLSHHFHQPFGPASNRQTVWERHYYRQAGIEKQVPGCIVLWLPLESRAHPHPGPEPYAMDTRREIGKLTAYREILRDFPHMRQHIDVRIVVGGHPNFFGLSVIRDELNNAVGRELPFYTDMRELINRAFVTARQ